MYQTLKNIVLALLPRQLLFANEERLRSLYAAFYAGSAYQCNICGKKLRRFIATPNNDLLCPNCGSLKRNRRLWHLLETEFLKPGSNVLDFSPSRCLYRRLKKMNGIEYRSTDLSGDFIADERFDITKIDCPDNRFDLVICYHILEHITNDALAMRELLRVMKPGATALVQTPFKAGEIYENDAIVSPKQRLEHFGQQDHVRVYSVNGLHERFKSAGFAVEIRNYAQADDQF